MSKGIIDEIVKTEANAAEIRRNADAYARTLFEKTSAECERLYSNAVEKAEKDARDMRENASAEAKSRIDALRVAAYSKAGEMTSSAEKNMDKAVKLIVDGIVEE